ncbi:hypothetical protein ACPCVO_46965 [Streptomyces umbrinus]|uniref:hypothetical protein n=1 Tax=Streptomyces umbrinus TaxID=67370 RepID=UPI003C2F5B9C
MAELWGTFAVNDHCRANAFVPELLLFDRLVIPVPATDAERARWRQPNPHMPGESWAPERLDRIRALLGSQHHEGVDGARLVWEAPWDDNRWRNTLSRREVAETITTTDAFGATRQILATGELPGVIEAVAAFPSEAECRDELRPEAGPPEKEPAAQALIALARPFLVPSGDEGDDFGPLREAMELVRDPDYRRARTAYHEWMRDFVGDLQTPGAGLRQSTIDAASIRLADECLHQLIAEERQVVQRGGRRKYWAQAGFAMTVASVSAGAAAAMMAPGMSALMGVGGAVAGFGGWIAERRAAEPPAPRPLGGASMFVAAQSRLNWE